jgi:pantoate--beta-alanine ligase
VNVVRTVVELRSAVSGLRAGGRRVALVPTMGALHEGHLSLVDLAARDGHAVVLTLFVNPTQFGAGEDLASYPRDEARDAALAETEGTDLLFAPATEEIYPVGFATTVEVSGLSEVLCGAPESRGAEHFRGVTTVVAKLLNLVRPDVAYFGQKDAQQAIVLRRMVRDLDFDVRIDVLPTVREPDGLAMSSRNRNLTVEERERALGLSRALRAAESAASAGERSVDAVLAAARAQLRDAGIEPEYLEARDAEDLAPARTLNGRPVLIALAATVGRARLIDNTLIGG